MRVKGMGQPLDKIQDQHPGDQKLPTQLATAVLQMAQGWAGQLLRRRSPPMQHRADLITQLL